MSFAFAAEREAAIAAAREAGTLLVKCLREGVACLDKGAHDIVTEADHASERQILERLHASFPDHGFVCEESGVRRSDAPARWYVDPLDGTKNFAHGHPGFCVTLAFECDGQLQLGVTYDPLRDELFEAALGSGATLNGAPIRVSDARRLDRALTTSGFPSGKRHRHMGAGAFEAMLHSCQALRRSGSTGLDLAYVACGRYDLMWDWALEPWDLAGGLVLVNEAGGQVRDWRGGAHLLSSSGVVAGNSELVGQAVAKLTAYDVTPS